MALEQAGIDYLTKLIAIAKFKLSAVALLEKIPVLECAPARPYVPGCPSGKIVTFGANSQLWESLGAIPKAFWN